MKHDDDTEAGPDHEKKLKHKKKIEWMIEHLEKGVAKGKIENKEEARRTIAFLEALHDQEVESEPKREKKQKKHQDAEKKKKPKSSSD